MADDISVVVFEQSGKEKAVGELRVLKEEMELRGTLLCKTWSELSHVMTRYQTHLINEHERIVATISVDEHERLLQLESLIDKKTQQLQTLENSIHDAEKKAQERDTEIVKLRTEVRKLRHDVCVKDSLLEKLQNQMQKETMDLQTEIASLKLVLSIENDRTSIDSISAIKKRRLVGKVPMESAALSLVGSVNRETQVQNRNAQPYSTTTQKYVKYSSNSSESLLSPSEIAANINLSSRDIRLHSHLAASNPTDVSVRGANLYKADELHDFEADDVIIINEQSEAVSQLIVQNYCQDQNPLGHQQKLETIVGVNNTSNRSQANHFSRPWRTRVSQTGDDGILHPCDMCSASFKRKDALKRHRRLHFGIRPYRCTLCDKRFLQRYNGTLHVRTNHGSAVSGDCGDYVERTLDESSRLVSYTAPRL